MIDAAVLSKVLSKRVLSVEDDLRVRAGDTPKVGSVVRAEWETAREAGRTDQSLEVWQEGLFTQVAVGWVLATVFIRFSEDNRLIPVPLLSGPGERRKIAEDGQTLFFREHPSEGERGFLLGVFERAAELPGLGEVLGSHSPVWMFGPSDDACRDLLALWRQVDPESGLLVWDFTDESWDTRFLGDLYQDLSESARKKFALLQTPDFIEEFILDRTLAPAVDEFGLVGFRVIDPACGSGHFLLGAFERLFERWQERDPAAGGRALAARALDSVFGVDLNPFAVAIARFRLLVAALKAAGIGTLAEAPVFHLNVAAGDSLLHGPPPGQLSMRIVDEQDPATRHLFATEDGDQVNRILSQKYHAVVANPPYITPPDKAANQLYRQRYRTCKGKYALTVPFMERLFDLATRGGPTQPAGYVGQITSNSFMKREFGKKLIEEYLSTEVDLAAVIDLGLIRPHGHTTPTVMILGRNRPPLADTVRSILGIEGDAGAGAQLAESPYWRSMRANFDNPGHEDAFISVVDLERGFFSSHPWSLLGGASPAILRLLEERSQQRVGDVASSIGVLAIPGTDDAFIASESALTRRRVKRRCVLVEGNNIRDYRVDTHHLASFPYGESLQTIEEGDLPQGDLEWLWPRKTVLRANLMFGRSKEQRGLRWYEWALLIRDRLLDSRSICYAEVATHGHFVYTSGSYVYKHSAPVIKLEAQDEESWVEVCAALNSSTISFWMHQVFQGKPNPGDTLWEQRYAFDSSKMAGAPLPDGSVLLYGQRLLAIGKDLGSLLSVDGPSRESFRAASARNRVLRRIMVSVQEELDWRAYHLYGLAEEDLSLQPDDAPPINKGERAFEIAMARKMAAGDIETSWFERHGSTPITELPDHWTPEYQALIERRLELIESDRFINLLERPEYKRRWDWDDWDTLEHQALEDWMLDRLETPTLWETAQVRSVNQLADQLRTDTEFTQVAELYAKTPDVDLAELIGSLVVGDAVPYLAAWRYTDSGLRKRAEWEKTWDLQRREDAGEDVGQIPVPPKYTTKDFCNKQAWKLRGKLDVPKERFISYPGTNRDTDPSLLIGWAGWDHLQQATALASWYERRRTIDGWDPERLTPILAGIAELVPWIKQWHNEPDPATGQRLGDFYQAFVTTECHTLNIPTTNLTTWKPPTTKRKKRAKSTT